MAMATLSDKKRLALLALFDGDPATLPLLFMIHTHPKSSFIIDMLITRGLTGKNLRRWIMTDFRGDVDAAFNSVRHRF